MDAPQVAAVEQVKLATEQLKDLSSGINSTSDNLSKPILELEALLKTLNLGVEAWVPVSTSPEPDGAVQHGELGYTKFGGKWALALRTRSDQATPGPPQVFGDAPRALRSAAIQHLPTLMNSLAEATRATKSALDDSYSFACAISSAVNNVLNTSKAASDKPATPPKAPEPSQTTPARAAESSKAPAEAAVAATPTKTPIPAASEVPKTAALPKPPEAKAAAEAPPKPAESPKPSVPPPAKAPPDPAAVVQK